MTQSRLWGKPRQHGLRHALAAPAVEREGIGEDRPDLLLQRIAQELSGAMQPGLDGLRLEVEQLGGLLDAHALDCARHQNRAKRVRQFVDRALQQRFDLALCDGPLGIGLSRGQRKRNDIALPCLPVLERVHIDGRTAASQPAHRFVEDDAREPGRETRVATETGERRQAANIAFLHDILRFAVVVHHRAGNTVKPSIAPLHDGAEGGGLALAGELHELGLVQGVNIELAFTVLHGLLLSLWRRYTWRIAERPAARKSMAARNSCRVAGLSRNTPSMRLVTMVASL